MPRLFVAACLPEEIKPALRAASGTLRGAASRAAMVHPDLFHLTLRFIGQVDERQALKLREWFLTLKAPCAAQCGMALDRYGSFPARDGLILWAGLDCGLGIEAFRQQVDEGLERFGYLPDNRAFVPHVTLARRARLNTPLAALAPLPLVEQACPAPVFVLFNSRLGPGGPQYHALAALKPA